MPVLRLAGHAGFCLLLVATAALGATALHVHFEGPTLWLLWALLGAVALASLVFRWRNRRLSWGLFLLGLLATGGWYLSLTPRGDRDWAPDVAHIVTSTREGDMLTVHDVRNFHWTSETEATPRWETRSYDLATLETVDMFTSVWDNPEIAHLIVSFGFAGGDHLAFSVEIRKEAHESFSILGGFFRKFELALIAADEADIVQLRTNQRQEDVRIYPIRLDAGQRKTLLLSYLDLGNRLAETPEFYNTVTANCTSTVYRLVQVIKPDLPLSVALLYSGRLPEYIDSLGGLLGEMPMAERREKAAITARALQIPAGATYSRWIRGEAG